MKKFQEKKSWKDVMKKKPILILLVFALTVIIWSDVNIFLRMQETAKNKKVEQEKINDLNKRKSELLKEIESLNSNTGVEENIRNKFGYVKDGEGVVVIVDEKISENEEKRENIFLIFLKRIFNK